MRKEVSDIFEKEDSMNKIPVKNHKGNIEYDSNSHKQIDSSYVRYFARSQIWGRGNEKNFKDGERD